MILSPAAFQIYLTALVNTGQKASISPAVRRRDSILAEISGSKFVAQTAVSGVSDLPSQEPGPALASAGTNLPPRHSSQDIAQVVLSGQPDLLASSPATSSPDLSKLTAAYGANGNASPIQVSIIERKLLQPLDILHTVMVFSHHRKGCLGPPHYPFCQLGSGQLVLYVNLHVPNFSSYILFCLVFLVILSVFFENTGFMKAGPRQSQFEPTEGKAVKFSDVHGVDEAKDVCVS